MLKKVVIIGPESTGKSTLCQQLAQHYNTLWVPEFAREYLLTRGREYGYDDLLSIAKGQLALEEEYIQLADGSLPLADAPDSNQEQSIDSPHSPFTIHHSPLLFIDTNMYVMKVWCEYVFGKCHSWILDQIIEREYDLYLLCNVDLPWIKDKLREYPALETRLQLYNMYKDILINQSLPWVEIRGDHHQRLHTAIEATDKLLNK